VYILSGARVKLVQLKKVVQEVVGVRSPAVVLPFGLAHLVATLSERFYRWTGATPRLTRYALRTVQESSDFRCDKARRELGYTPRPLRDSIADTLAWWRHRWGCNK